MNATHVSKVSKRTYKLEVFSEDLIDPDTGHRAWGYKRVVGVVNGKRLMARFPVSVENVSAAAFDTMDAMRRFLDGGSHPTHYADFPELGGE